MIRVKICGITRLRDAMAACACGADALGFVFHDRSPRFISPDKASRIIRTLPPFVSSVGVFVDSSLDDILRLVTTCGLTAVQLHGVESPEFCRRIPVKVIKTFRVKSNRLPVGLSSYDVDAILLDTFVQGVPGGTGRPFPWQLARAAAQYGRVILAGGLNAGNVVEAIEAARPYGVDVSSGVEQTPGRKDLRLMKQFINRIKEYQKVSNPHGQE